MIKISLIAILALSLLINASNASIEDSIEKNINSEIKDIQNSKLSKETKDLLGEIYSRKLKDNKARKKQKITIDRFKNNKTDGKEYETLQGNNGINIVIKKPGNKLKKKLKLYQEAFYESKNKKYESAIIKFEKILQQYPQDRIALSGVASSYHRIGEFELANDYYLKVLKLYPNDQKATNNFLTLLAEEAPDESLLELLKLDRISKNNPVLKAQIANLYVYKKDYEEALNYIQYAIVIDNNNLSYHFNKAVILNKLGLKKEANKILRRIISQNHHSDPRISFEKIKKQLN